MHNPKDIKQEWSPVLKTAGGGALLGGESQREEVDFADNASGQGSSVSQRKGFFLLVRFVQYLAYPLGFFLRWWLRATIEDPNETFKKESRNVIFAASHFSEIDILLIPSIFGFFSRHFPVRFFTFESKFYKTEIAKGNLLKKIFYGGWVFDICGACAFDRKNKHLPYRIKLANHIELLKDFGHSLIIFPSGTIDPLGVVTKVLPGTAVLSYYSRRPVVPIRVVLSCPLTLRSFFFRKTSIKFEVKAPFYPEDLFTASLLDSRTAALELHQKDIEQANAKILQVFRK